MKKTFKTLFLSLLAIAGFASCEKEQNGEEGGAADSKSLTIIAVTDGELVPTWNEGDKIKVSCDGKSYDFTTATTGKSAKFTDDGSLTAELIGDNAISAYFNCTSARGAFRISGEQTYADGKSSAVIPMYAYTLNSPQDNNLALTFKPVASILDITLPAHSISVESIVIAPAEGATISEGAIAGTYQVDAAQGTITVNADAGQVELLFSTPLDIKQGATVKVPVGMFAISGGLDIVLKYESTKQMIYTVGTESLFQSYDDATGVKTGKVIPVTFEIDANSFPRDYYVTASASATAKGQSWSEPATLDYALQNAMAGSVIHVAAGTYYPTKALPYTSEETISLTEEHNGFEVNRNIKIVGGYPAAGGATADASANKTILDGNNKSWHVLVVGAPKTAGEIVEIEGITIQGGKNIADNTYNIVYGEEDNQYKIAGNYGAGLGLVNTAASLKNVTVCSNNGVSAAGVFAVGSKVSMTTCEVSGNTSSGNGAGIWFSADTELVMEGCTIKKNDAGTAGIVGGLYLHAPEGKSLVAEIKNTTITENTAKAQSGAYIRDDSGVHLLTAKFTGCTISSNTGGMGSALQTLNANITFSSCKFSENKGTSNGIVVIYDNTNAIFDNCVFESNETTGGGGAIYAYTNTTDATPNVNILNSVFYNNKANAKGTVWCRGDKGSITLNCVNNTFHGNATTNVGSAINLYKNVTANIISNTIVGNTCTYTKDDSRAGAVCLEAAPLTVNSYNNIIAGNLRSADNTNEDVKVKAGTITYKYSFVGSDYYGAEGSVVTVSPTFDYTTMVGAYSNGVMKLIGTASANPAVENGMPAASLKALANDYISSEVLGKDQLGTTRSGTVAGACVTQ